MSNSSTLKPGQNEDAAAGPRCQNCGAAQPAREPVCRRCGYYAVLGRVIELEEYDQDETENPQKKPAPTFWEVWSKLIPAWGVGIIICVLAVVVESVVGACTLPVGSHTRALWSLSQLGVSALTLMVLHVMAYVSFMMLDSSAGLLDFILKPIACWKPVFAKLPRTFIRVALAACALTGILMSLLVLRSLNYEALLDWGGQPPVKHNLLGAVIDQAKKIEAKEETLEEALNSLEDPTKDLEPKEPPRIEVDCVIIGYTTTKEDPRHFSTLVLAGEVGGKLKVVGYLSASIPSDIRAGLDKRLAQIARKEPFVKTALTANWVEPQIVCRVKCLKQKANGELEDPLFDKLLSEISLK